MTYRILKFNVALVGARNVGKSILFPKSEEEKVTVRHEIISEVEADVHIYLTEFALPDETQLATEFDPESHGLIAVYDVASKESLEALNDFLVFSESDPIVNETLLIIGFNQGVQPREVYADAINEMSRGVGATYLEVSRDFMKGLDIAMRRFASNLIRHADK